MQSIWDQYLDFACFRTDPGRAFLICVLSLTLHIGTFLQGLQPTSMLALNFLDKL